MSSLGLSHWMWAGIKGIKSARRKKSSTREVRMDLKGILVTSEWEVCPVGRSWEHEKGKDT